MTSSRLLCIPTAQIRYRYVNILFLARLKAVQAYKYLSRYIYVYHSIHSYEILITLYTFQENRHKCHFIVNIVVLSLSRLFIHDLFSQLKGVRTSRKCVCVSIRLFFHVENIPLRLNLQLLYWKNTSEFHPSAAGIFLLF